MATKIHISGGEVNCVYDDRFRPILEALGVSDIKRATDVEYNQATKEWEAKLFSTGQIIAHGPNRNDVIAAEVKWLEENHVAHRNS